jgi:hypothetical protein
MSWFSLTVEKVNTRGVAGGLWIRIPPNAAPPAVLAPLPLIVVFLMSKPAPSMRTPPAVLLLTLTWSSRAMTPPSAQRPGEPPVIERSRM